MLDADHGVPTSRLRQIDQICDRFESEWRNERTPRIEDYLSLVTPSDQRALLAELLALEFDYRRRGGEQPDATDYCRRFPQHAEQIRATLAGERGAVRREAVSLEQFVQHLTESGLLSAAEVSSFRDSLPPEERPQDAEALARQLVEVKKLTQYQVQAVKQGETKSLVFDEYVVLDKIGQGGMGVVLKAEHRRMKRVVAVKVLPPVAMKTPQSVQRFYREVEAAARLNHPNIVTAYDAREYRGSHCLVMEYIDGQDLGAIVKEKGSLPIAQAVDFIIQAAHGLQCAHEQGIVHRDIKPSNLLLDKKGTVKILDMGLARIAGLVEEVEADRLTASGQVMGTCDYMAPEQAMDTHQADARADIYSLGCTLYRLLAGDAMYKGETLMMILLAHQQAPVPSLCQACKAVPPQLDAVFQKMVAKKPEDRYQSMAEVIADLETCIGRQAGKSTLVSEEATATFSTDENLSFLRQQTSPRSMATVVEKQAVEKQVERLGEATISQQAAAAETSKHVSRDVTLLVVPRKKKTLAAVIGLGLLGVIGVVALAIIIHIRRPDGTAMTLALPNGSNVTIGEEGDVDLAVTAKGGTPVTCGPDAPPRAVASFDEKNAKQHQEAWAKYLGMPVEMTNAIGMKLVLIPPGEFEMGATPEEIARALEEGRKTTPTDKNYLSLVLTEAPRHRVKITKPFYLGTYAVTQGEYERVMGVNPSAFTAKQMDASGFKPPLPEFDVTYRSEFAKKLAGKDTSRHPVDSVHWEDATDFCRRLSEMPDERAAKRGYRLPTEAEWEYACRAGTTTRWYCGDDEAGLADTAWSNKNSGSMAHPAGEKKPNAWGLYDMHGNVYQWCGDRFSQDYYKLSPINDPSGPAGGYDHILRGGSWYFSPSRCRSACRTHREPTHRAADRGFRVMADVVAKKEAGKQPTPVARSSSATTGNSLVAPPLAMPTIFSMEAAQIQMQ